MSMSSHSIDLPSLMNNPFDLSPSGLSYHDATRVELVEYLMAAAEKVGNNRTHDQAIHLLDLCDCLSSKTGDPIQRIVYYFSQALRERVGYFNSAKNRNNRPVSCRDFNAEKALTTMHLQLFHSLQEKIPFWAVVQMSGIQILLENVGNSKRIHMIDLQIRTGLQWTGFMQALASRLDHPRIELLKITAVGTSTFKNLMESTGTHLTGFARAMRIPFYFRIVVVSDVHELREEMFEIDQREALAVYSEGYMKSLIAAPDKMDALLKLLRSFSPRIMVVSELEANYNSVTFSQLFVEALFSFAAMFDCLDVCFEGSMEKRSIAESGLLREWIRSVVVKEGEEREFRCVKLNVWRTFFARVAMMECKLSAAVLYQAKLVLNRFACGEFCRVDVDGRSLIVGWKDTPILSISSWKFARLRKLKDDVFE
ncbi:DELLA protein RGL2 [Linum grandiflorum]